MMRIFLKLVTLISAFKISNSVPFDSNCAGKAFHCVNSTHFQICVSLGPSKSIIIEDYVIQCPSGTQCDNGNYYECELPKSTTVAPEMTTITSKVVITSENNLNKLKNISDVNFPKQDGIDSKQNASQSSDLHIQVSEHLSTNTSNAIENSNFSGGSHNKVRLSERSTDNILGKNSDFNLQNPVGSAESILNINKSNVDILPTKTLTADEVVSEGHGSEYDINSTYSQEPITLEPLDSTNEIKTINNTNILQKNESVFDNINYTNIEIYNNSYNVLKRNNETTSNATSNSSDLLYLMNNNEDNTNDIETLIATINKSNATNEDETNNNIVNSLKGTFLKETLIENNLNNTKTEKSSYLSESNRKTNENSSLLLFDNSTIKIVKSVIVNDSGGDLSFNHVTKDNMSGDIDQVTIPEMGNPVSDNPQLASIDLEFEFNDNTTMSENTHDRGNSTINQNRVQVNNNITLIESQNDSSNTTTFEIMEANLELNKNTTISKSKNIPDNSSTSGEIIEPELDNNITLIENQNDPNNTLTIYFENLEASLELMENITINENKNVSENSPINMFETIEPNLEVNNNITLIENQNDPGNSTIINIENIVADPELCKNITISENKNVPDNSSTSVFEIIEPKLKVNNSITLMEKQNYPGNVSTINIENIEANLELNKNFTISEHKNSLGNITSIIFENMEPTLVLNSKTTLYENKNEPVSNSTITTIVENIDDNKQSEYENNIKQNNLEGFDSNTSNNPERTIDGPLFTTKLDDISESISVNQSLDTKPKNEPKRNVENIVISENVDISDQNNRTNDDSTQFFYSKDVPVAKYSPTVPENEIKSNKQSKLESKNSFQEFTNNVSDIKELDYNKFSVRNKSSDDTNIKNKQVGSNGDTVTNNTLKNSDDEMRITNDTNVLRNISSATTNIYPLATQNQVFDEPTIATTLTNDTDFNNNNDKNLTFIKENLFTKTVTSNVNNIQLLLTSNNDIQYRRQLHASNDSTLSQKIYLTSDKLNNSFSHMLNISDITTDTESLLQSVEEKFNQTITVNYLNVISNKTNINTVRVQIESEDNSHVAKLNEINNRSLDLNELIYKKKVNKSNDIKNDTIFRSSVDSLLIKHMINFSLGSINMSAVLTTHVRVNASKESKEDMLKIQTNEFSSNTSSFLPLRFISGNTTVNLSTKAENNVYQVRTVDALLKSVNQENHVYITNNGFNCDDKQPGLYKDPINVNFYYVCLSINYVRLKCDGSAIFNDALKKCLNISNFKCMTEGRFADEFNSHYYYLCVRNEVGFTKYILQCKSGYHTVIDKKSVRCVSDSYKPIASKNGNKHKSSEAIDNLDFRCERAGKFPDNYNMRKYYICTRGHNKIFRKKVKFCDDDEVFDVKRKHCMEVED